MGLKDTHLYKKDYEAGDGADAGGPAEVRVGEDDAAGDGAGDGEDWAVRAGIAGRTGGVAFRVSDAEICGVAMKMLRNQFYRETIPRYIEKLDATETGSGIASKTGSLDAVRADVAIVAGKSGPMVLSIFTYENDDHGWTVDNEGEVTIAKLAKAIVDAWSPAGIDGKTAGAWVGACGVICCGVQHRLSKGRGTGFVEHEIGARVESMLVEDRGKAVRNGIHSWLRDI